MDDEVNDYYFICFDDCKIEGLIEAHDLLSNIDFIENLESDETIYSPVCNFGNYCIVDHNFLFAFMIFYSIQKEKDLKKDYG